MSVVAESGSPAYVVDSDEDVQYIPRRPLASLVPPLIREPAQRPRVRPYVREVIVISSDEDEEEIQEIPQDDRFGDQRRAQRNQRAFYDQAARLRRRRDDDPPYPDQPPRLPSPALLPPIATPPRIRLGGGGILDRIAGFTNRNHNLLERARRAFHERSLYLDAFRLGDRIRQYNATINLEEHAAFARITARMNALEANMRRMADEGEEDDEADERYEALQPLLLAADVYGGGREEMPIHLPNAPKYEVSFTHAGPMKPGFTSDFVPQTLETITIEDDSEAEEFTDEDDSTMKGNWKGKGKARRRPSPVKPAITAPAPTLICPVCKDPLRMGGTSENERLYGLRCGHVLDGKCLWTVAKPDDGNKAKGQLKDEDDKMEVDPNFEFTFTAPTKKQRDDDGEYQEIEDPTPRVFGGVSRLRSGREREIVPTPNPSRRRRGQYRGRLDGVDDDPEQQQAAEGSTSVAGAANSPRLDLTDPFFPVLVNPPTARAAVKPRGRLRRRKVPKTRGKLQEEVFDWTCPVEGCAHAHASVRLIITGAPWRSDEEKGAIAMFL
ncbi:hypothetical protein FRC17_001672 [Serendipita sp. 399]|nr:hypothetical protein FRC17_001672 [Serendipita sp. 399]